MKCGIMTFHRAINYGAILQTYALQQTIEKLGCECEVIDYRSEFLERYYKPLSLRNISLRSIRMIIAILLKNGVFFPNHHSFRSFSDQFLKCSPEIYRSNLELKKANEKYDLFIAGSDQVWSYLTAGFDKSYFLDFVEDNRKKNSYAASFGVDSIPEEFVAEYTNLLRGFNNISVREEQGAHIINDLLNIKPQVVVDPTLLLDKNEWSKVASRQKEDQKYLLLYLMAEKKSTLDLAKKTANERDLKIIYINDRWFKRPGMDNRSKVSVENFISLFMNADFVVTNSFHGIAFSINFKKDFYVQYLPEPAKVNSRLENILRIFNLTERRVENINQIDSQKTISYDEVHERLEGERKKALNYLNNLISRSN